MKKPDAAILKRAAEIASSIQIGPRMHPCVCGAERHEHGGTSLGGQCARTSCRRYRPDLAHTLAYAAVDADKVQIGDAIREADARERASHYRRNPRKPGEWSIGASDAGSCPRKIQYRNAPPEDFVPSPEDSPEARMGTIIHRETTRQLRRLYPWREFNVRVVIAGLDRKSELDSYDPVTGIVDDIKTAGDWRWDMLAEDGPDWETWEQVLLYGLALHEEGRKVVAVRLSYIKRCNGADEVFTIPFDIEAARAARRRLLGYAQMLDVGVDLPKTGTGPTTDALCRRCFARDDCWNIPLAERLGRSPENVTILGEHPEDEEIAWAIEEKVTASAARLAAAKVEEQKKALVDGIEPGRYGGPEGPWESWYEIRKGSPNHKADAENLRALLDLPPDERPVSSAVVPVPRYQGSRLPKVGRVRKATLNAEKAAKGVLEKESKA